MTGRKKPETLRSHRWFGPDSMRAFAHRQRLQQTGHRAESFQGKPVIGIINTWSDISTCHSHLKERAQQVRAGILKAGGFPLELPALSLGEVMVKPTAMYYRNLLAMETEELLRSHPLDGVVLMGGCDKTTPGLLMGAISMNIPALFVPAGATLNGWWRGQKIGTGTHTRKYWDAYRAGDISKADWQDLEASMTRSAGTCNTMGTASSMTGMAEILGMCPTGSMNIPAVDSAHIRMANDAGERIVEMVWADLKPKDILTRESFENAIILHMALGGSTNAIVHMLALAGRAGIDLSLADIGAYAGKIPVLANLMPSGTYLMEDFHYAGGLPGLLTRLTPYLKLDCLTVSGNTLAENLSGACVYHEDVIRPLDNPVTDKAALTVLSGNLAPNGAVIKPSAASEHLLHHRGPALVFEDHAEMSAHIDDPDLDVTADTVLVLKNAGPKGGPGMPEWGALPIPKKLLKQGVRDMLRLSDSRMSGTHFGTCVLHIAPESYIGGPLALVQNGDEIELNLSEARLTLHVSDTELAQRKVAWQQPAPKQKRGYGVLVDDHMTQADQGCDFDFLMGTDPVAEPDIY